MSEPKCPGCQSEGIDNIISRPSDETSREGQPWFFVAYCKLCGHVYGVFAKHVFGPRGGPQLIVNRN